MQKIINLIYKTFLTSLKWKMPENKHSRLGTKTLLQKPLKTCTAMRNIKICWFSDVGCMRYWWINDRVPIKTLIIFPSVCLCIHPWLGEYAFSLLNVFLCQNLFYTVFQILLKKLLNEVALYILQEKVMLMKWFVFSSSCSVILIYHL